MHPRIRLVCSVTCAANYFSHCPGAMVREANDIRGHGFSRLLNVPDSAPGAENPKSLNRNRTFSGTRSLSLDLHSYRALKG